MTLPFHADEMKKSWVKTLQKNAINPATLQLHFAGDGPASHLGEIGVATFTVTGGTGRLESATGTGTTEVVATPNETGLAGTFVLTLRGRIWY